MKAKINNRVDRFRIDSSGIELLKSKKIKKQYSTIKKEKGNAGNNFNKP